MKTVFTFLILLCIISIHTFAQQQIKKNYISKEVDIKKPDKQGKYKTKFVLASMHKNGTITEKDTLMPINRERKETYSMYKYKK